jgi:hypothetical protein
MKINFTKSEYRTLLDVIYMADWILHAHDTEDRSDSGEYLNLFQKLMSHAKAMDCEDYVVFDEEQKKYSESYLFEEESPALKYIDEFENDSFWGELVSRLARRDVLAEFKPNNPGDIETEELFVIISEAEDKWSKEFEAYDLSRIRLDNRQLDTIH